MPVYILLRASKKTGKVNRVLTGITPALMKMYALQHTPKTMLTLIIERDTGRIIECFTGAPDDMPKRENIKDTAHCSDFGLSVDDLKKITDDRFDKAP